MMDAFSAVETPKGKQIAQRIAQEKWFQFMYHSWNRVMSRLGAQLLITGVLQELEPQRFLDPDFYTNPGKRMSWAERRKLAIEAYEKKQKEMRLCG